MIGWFSGDSSLGRASIHTGINTVRVFFPLTCFSGLEVRHRKMTVKCKSGPDLGPDIALNGHGFQ